MQKNIVYTIDTVRNLKIFLFNCLYQLYSCMLLISYSNVRQRLYSCCHRGRPILCHSVSVEITRDSEKSERDHHRDLVGSHCHRTSGPLLLRIHGKTMEELCGEILHGGLAPSVTIGRHLRPRKAFPQSLLDLFTGGVKLGPHAPDDGGLYRDFYQAEEESQGVQNWASLDIRRATTVQEKGNRTSTYLYIHVHILFIWCGFFPHHLHCIVSPLYMYCRNSADTAPNTIQSINHCICIYQRWFWQVVLTENSGRKGDYFCYLFIILTRDDQSSTCNRTLDFFQIVPICRRIRFTKSQWKPFSWRSFPWRNHIFISGKYLWMLAIC